MLLGRHIVRTYIVMVSDSPLLVYELWRATRRCWFTSPGEQLAVACPRALASNSCDIIGLYKGKVPRQPSWLTEIVIL